MRAELWSTAQAGGPGSKIVDLVVPDAMEAGSVDFSAPANGDWVEVTFSGVMLMRVKGQHR